jgi:phosphohistidine phosphatase
MDVYLLRHGEAVPHGSRDSDALRELTPTGEEQSRAAGGALAALGVELAASYASPKVRARDTARLACESLGLETVEVKAIASGFDVDALQDLLHAHDAEDKVLVSGHNPDFAQLVHDLTGARVDFPKGGIVVVRLDGKRGELRSFWRPKALTALARTLS